MNENPHLADDFFGMLTRYLKYQPDIVFKSQALEQLLELAQIGIPIDHIKAGVIILLFCIKIIDIVFENSLPNQQSNSIENAKKLLLAKYGQLFLHKSVILIKNDPPEDIIENLEELFCSIALNYK